MKRLYCLIIACFICMFSGCGKQTEHLSVSESLSSEITESEESNQSDISSESCDETKEMASSDDSSIDGTEKSDEEKLASIVEELPSDFEIEVGVATVENDENRATGTVAESSSITITIAPESDEDYFENEDGSIKLLTWEEFNGLSAESQDKYMSSFEDTDAFLQWYYEAQRIYEEKNPELEIGQDGSINLGR